jgi:hypothetical protein
MALAGIAALAGRDMSKFGDLTDLQEKLEEVNIVQDAEFEEIDDE